MHNDCRGPRPTCNERCLLAHELNNDLSVIYGHCELLGDLVGQESRMIFHVHMIQEAARHMMDNLAVRPCPMVACNVAVGA